MATPHIEAKKGEIASVVLMPGDPLRAEVMANHFLKDVKKFNSVRNMFGFTGTYKGKKVSIMGSGMGMPSIGIYSYELFKFYGVEKIIRIGSAGAYIDDLDLYSVVLANSAYSESSYGKTFGLDENPAKPSHDLNEAIKNAAKDLKIKVFEKPIHSSDVFYHLDSEYHLKITKKWPVACVEMESFALFQNAKALGKQAACLLTISDSFTKKTATDPKERQNNFMEMVKVALEAAIK